MRNFQELLLQLSESSTAVYPTTTTTDAEVTPTLPSTPPQPSSARHLSPCLDMWTLLLLMMVATVVIQAACHSLICGQPGRDCGKRGPP